jgi:hypothetical protein
LLNIALVPSGEDPTVYFAGILALIEKLKKDLKVALNRINELISVHFKDVAKTREMLSISCKPEPFFNACLSSFSGLPLQDESTDINESPPFLIDLIYKTISFPLDHAPQNKKLNLLTAKNF